MIKYMQTPGAPAIREDDSKQFDELDELLAGSDANIRHQIASAIGAQCIKALDDAVTLPQMVRAINGAQASAAAIEKHMTGSQVTCEIRAKLEEFHQRGERGREEMLELQELTLDENADPDEREEMMIRMELRGEHFGYAAQSVLRLKHMPQEKKIATVKNLFQKALASGKPFEVAYGLDAMVELGQVAEPQPLMEEMLSDLIKKSDWNGYDDFIEHYRLYAHDKEKLEYVSGMLTACFGQLTDHLISGLGTNKRGPSDRLSILHLLERCLRVDSLDGNDSAINAVEPTRKQVAVLLKTIKDAIGQLSTDDDPENRKDERIRDLYIFALEAIFRTHGSCSGKNLKADWAGDYRKWYESAGVAHYDDTFAKFNDRDGKSTTLLECEHAKRPRQTQWVVMQRFDTEYERLKSALEAGQEVSFNRLFELSELKEKLDLGLGYSDWNDLIGLVFKMPYADLQLNMLHVILSWKEKLCDDWDKFGPELFRRYSDEFKRCSNEKQASFLRKTLVWLGDIMKEHAAPGADEVVQFARQEMHKELAPGAFAEGFTQSFLVKQALQNISSLYQAGGSVDAVEETNLWKIFARAENETEVNVACKLYAAVKISRTDCESADEIAQKAFDAYVGRVLSYGRKTKEQIIADLMSMQVIDDECGGKLFMQDEETWKKARQLLKELCWKNGGNESTLN